MAKSFGCVGIEIESKNISISADIGGNIVYQIGRIRDTETIFLPAYPQMLTGRDIYPTKNMAVFIKNAVKSTKA